jgi:hypothetical protein
MVRQPIPAEPRQIEQLRLRVQAQWYSPPFIFLDVHRPWRKVRVSDSRGAVDFAVCMRELTDVHFPKAECIRVVLDNLSTRTRRARSTTPLPLVKHGGCCAGSSSIMSPSTPAS